MPRSGRLIVAFQPHTFSRTEALSAQFCSALADCDSLILLKEYAAREIQENGMSAKRLFFYLKNKDKIYCETLLDAAAEITKKSAPEDMILVLGAGDIALLCEILTTSD